jgi:DNA-binding GntR family transcriptional regulator
VDELDELYGIVWSLEVYALHKAVPMLTDADIVAMQTLFGQMEAEPDPVKWYGLNVAFHRHPIAASNLHRILQTIDAARWNICRYVIDPLLFARERINWQERNRTLLDACRRRDLKAALRAVDAMRTLSTVAVRRHLAGARPYQAA